MLTLWSVCLNALEDKKFINEETVLATPEDIEQETR
jgi:hypothetical protein